MNNEVFYVCYGSNLYEQRFREYLNDNSWFYSFSKSLGDDEIAQWEQYLNEESNQPLESYRVNLTHDVYFAGSSGRWGGGIAYLDVDGFSCKRVYRAYRISTDKFESVFSQENGYYSGGFDWDRIVSHRETRTSASFYGRIVNLGSIDGTPALTFTSNTSLAELKDRRYSWGDGKSYRGYRDLNPPGQPYKDVINRGRAETQKLTFKEIAPLN